MNTLEKYFKGFRVYPRGELRTPCQFAVHLDLNRERLVTDSYGVWEASNLGRREQSWDEMLLLGSSISHNLICKVQFLSYVD